MTPTVHPNNMLARIARARDAFAKGQTTDGQPYPREQQKRDEAGLALDVETRQQYVLAAHWGLSKGLIEASEAAGIESVLTSGLILDTGWHVSADLAVKVIVTKLCNELLTLRGDA